MDALSSSSFSAMRPSKLLLTTSTVTTPPLHPLVPLLNASSSRLEEEPQTSTMIPKTTTRKTSPSSASTTPTTAPFSTKKLYSPNNSNKNKTPGTGGANAKRHVVQQATLPTMMFNALDNIINSFIDPPLRPSVNPRYVLCDNFAPVDELPPTQCEVMEGSLPPCLDGAYIRNGPNSQYLPRGPYHLFDGDGMLHSIKISQGKATLCSRYVETYKYTMEHHAGAPLLPNVFSGFNGLTASAARGALTTARILAGQFNPTNGIGLANTSLAFFGNRLYALGESDLPCAVRLTSTCDIQTVCRHDCDGKLLMSMTAHPKIDLETGEAFAF